MKCLHKLCIALTVLTLAKAKISDVPKQQVSKNQMQNICKTQQNGTILANPYDCHKFYMCVNQNQYEYNCDMAYHYDASTRSCVKGSSCSRVFNKPLTCIEGNISGVEDNCNIFEVCIEGKYQKLDCPPNYYFNMQQGICVPFKYDAEFICNCLMPEYTVLENKNNCETYFVCHKKTAILESCPWGQYYNAELSTCLSDLEGVCLMKPTVIPKPVDVQAICSALGLKDIHFQTFPKGCKTFFICVNGQLFTQNCPPNFYYDSLQKYCVVDTINKCSNTEDFSKNV